MLPQVAMLCGQLGYGFMGRALFARAKFDYL